MSKHVLQKLDASGHTETCWDTAAPATVVSAEAAFDELRRMGYATFALDGDEGSDGRQIKDFDATAPRIVAVPALVGG